MSTPTSHADSPIPINPDWEILPADVRTALDAGENLVLLDVRNPREWAFCRLQHAVFAPLPELEAKAQHELQPLKSQRIIAYCHHGIRSLRAAAILRHLGYQNVRSMAGGIDAWSLSIDPAIPRY